MSVNRNSDLSTSSEKNDVTIEYLNLSSSDRDRTVYPDSAYCKLDFEEYINVIQLNLLAFEIPHTRYAIDSQNNTFYLSEKWGEDEYYFFSLKASTGGYTISNLAVTLELSTSCPYAFNGDVSLKNKYNFVTSASFGKVAVTSSGDCEYSLHHATETVTLTSITKNSDTEAIVTFLSSCEYLYAPGALLTLKPNPYSDREVQILEMIDGRKCRLLGDFSDLDENSISLTTSTMVPYSADNSVSLIMGFGSTDLTGYTAFDVLGVQSPFDASGSSDTSQIMINTNFPLFVTTGNFIMLNNVGGFLGGNSYEIVVTHDDTHAEILVDRTALWEHQGGTIASSNDPGTSFAITDIQISAIENNIINLVIESSDTLDLSIGDSVVLAGFNNTEMSDITPVVVGVGSSNEQVTIQFRYPINFLIKNSNTRIITNETPSVKTELKAINPTTGIYTTYMTKNRFDLSRGRRMVLCKATIDNQDIGNVQIPSLTSSKFFGRIQLFSGADLVNFLSGDTAVGTHKFNSLLKRLRSITFRFYNEDGSDYDFIGVDYTIFLEVITLDTNKGI